MVRTRNGQTKYVKFKWWLVPSTKLNRPFGLLFPGRLSFSHNGMRLISVRRHRCVLEGVDKSLKTEVNGRRSKKHEDRSTLTGIPTRVYVVHDHSIVTEREKCRASPN